MLTALLPSVGHLLPDHVGQDLLKRMIFVDRPNVGVVPQELLVGVPVFMGELDEWADDAVFEDCGLGGHGGGAGLGLEGMGYGLGLRRGLRGRDLLALDILST